MLKILRKIQKNIWFHMNSIQDFTEISRQTIYQLSKEEMLKDISSFDSKIIIFKALTEERYYSRIQRAILLDLLDEIIKE